MTKKKQKVNWKLASVGIVCITILESIALLQGINGTRLSITIAIIAVAIGVAIPTDIIKRILTFLK